MTARSPLSTAKAAGVLAALALVLTGCQMVDAEEPSADSPAETTVRERYVALGDSYTAAPLYPLEDDVITGCLRSTGNYPTLVAEELDLAVVDVSCSGASTVSMFHPQRFERKARPPQLDALRPDTTLVTLGIGANDFTYFSRMMFECLELAVDDPTGSPCRDRQESDNGSRRLDRQLQEIRARVSRVVTAIEDRSPQARVLMIGYPQLLPDEGTCPANLPLADGDWDWTRDLNKRLIENVRDGAEDAGAEYVDLAAASKGHDICSTEPWVAGVRGDGGRAAGLHPYPAEQRAVAELIIDLVAT